MLSNDTPITPALLTELSAQLPDRAVTSQEAMIALVRSDGDLIHAGVQLRTQPHNVLVAIVTDPNNHDILAKYFRAHQTTKIFGLIGTLIDSVEEEIHELPIREKARTLVALLGVFNSLTESAASSAPAGNPVETIMKMLPPEVQEHVRTLARDTMNPHANLTNLMANGPSV